VLDDQSSTALHGHITTGTGKPHYGWDHSDPERSLNREPAGRKAIRDLHDLMRPSSEPVTAAHGTIDSVADASCEATAGPPEAERCE
jgi:hypothetical protein